MVIVKTRPSRRTIICIWILQKLFSNGMRGLVASRKIPRMRKATARMDTLFSGLILQVIRLRHRLAVMNGYWMTQPGLSKLPLEQTAPWKGRHGSICLMSGRY